MGETNTMEAIAAIIKDRSQREALAEMIVEFIQPNHVSVEIMSKILNSRSLKPGDSLVKKIRKGIKVWTWVPGSIGLKSEVTVSERMNYVLDGAIVGILANEWDLMNGDIGTAADLRNEALAKLRDYYLGKAHTALSTVWSAANTPNNFVNVGGALSQTALEDAINRINQTTPRAKAIVGVRSALTPLTKFGPFWDDGTTYAGSQSKIDEVLNTGWIGNYMGVPVVALPQVWDNPEDHTALMPTDKVLVIGENVGEFITYGNVMTKEWTDNEPTPPYWHLDMYQQFGMIIDNAEGIYVIGGLS